MIASVPLCPRRSVPLARRFVGLVGTISFVKLSRPSPTSAASRPSTPPVMFARMALCASASFGAGRAALSSARDGGRRLAVRSLATTATRTALPGRPSLLRPSATVAVVRARLAPARALAAAASPQSVASTVADASIKPVTSAAADALANPSAQTEAASPIVEEVERAKVAKDALARELFEEVSPAAPAASAAPAAPVAPVASASAGQAPIAESLPRAAPSFSSVSSFDSEDSDGYVSSASSRSGSFASLFGGEEEDVVLPPEGSVAVSESGLSTEIVEALEAKGIAHLFPVQSAVLEPALAGRDILARARTGSGKTLAFALPIAERVLEARAQGAAGAPRQRHPLALVLTPTRELAQQVERELSSVAPKARVACIFGGTHIGPQLDEVRRGVDVVVGTPGRVQDLMDRGVLKLESLKMAVLDEADQMLSVGFAEDVDRILGEAPEQRQTLLFSATTPPWIAKLVRTQLTKPVTVDLVGAGSDKTSGGRGAGAGDSGRLAETVTPKYVRVEERSRRAVLVDLLTVHGGTKGVKAIVFCATKREADEVAAAIAPHLSASALHGDVAQSERTLTLEAFRTGQLSILVATDVAARGLDIPNVDLVVHYDLPQEVESFLHRSGRTGRAGRKGTAVALVSRRDEARFVRILKEAHATHAQAMAPPSTAKVLECATLAAAGRLDNVDQPLKDRFQSAADAVLAARDPRDALAAALAALSGLVRVPEKRSLLTAESDLTTLVVRQSDRPYDESAGRAGRPVPPGRIYEAVRLALDLPASQDAPVGRIRFLADGSAFDLPKKLAERAMAAAETLRAKGIYISEPDELEPEPIELKATGRAGGFNNRGDRRDSYGRDRRSGGRDGYSRDRRGGRDGFNGDRRDRRPNKSYDDFDRYGREGGRRDNRKSGGRSEFRGDRW